MITAATEPDTFRSVGGGSALVVQFARVEKKLYVHLLEEAWRAIAPKKLLRTPRATHEGR